MSEWQQPTQQREPGATAPVTTPPPAPPPAPVDTRSTTAKVGDTARNIYHLARIILLIVLGFIVALFVVRNWKRVDFDFVFGSVELPLAIVMLIFTVIGIVVGMLLLWFMRRRH